MYFHIIGEYLGATPTLHLYVHWEYGFLIDM